MLPLTSCGATWGRGTAAAGARSPGDEGAADLPQDGGGRQVVRPLVGGGQQRRGGGGVGAVGHGAGPRAAELGTERRGPAAVLEGPVEPAVAPVHQAEADPLAIGPGGLDPALPPAPLAAPHAG